MQYLEINEENRKVILELFDKGIDEEGYIVDETGKRVTCPYTKEQIRSDDFSILPGSATFVKNRSYCFAEHIARH
ncbi:MAG: hypothetical protein R6U17_08805 [Thermoplasmata archaeon]